MLLTNFCTRARPIAVFTVCLVLVGCPADVPTLPEVTDGQATNDSTGDTNNTTEAEGTTTEELDSTTTTDEPSSTTGSDGDDNSTEELPGETTAEPPGTDCGNGVIEGTEECDDGPENGDTRPCLLNCTNARCGDKKTLAPDPENGVEGEVCDYGDAGNTGGYGACAPDCQSLGPYCGDGTWQPEYELCEGEDGVVAESGVVCDNSKCRHNAKLVFIVDYGEPGVDYSGKFNFDYVDGVLAADWICHHLAADAGIISLDGDDDPATPNFRAWLSTTDEPVAERFVHWPNAYVLTDGNLVAESWGALLSNGPLTPINKTQRADLVADATVWSNTSTLGYALSDTFDCFDWMSNGATLKGFVGTNNTELVDWSAWTFFEGFGARPCNLEYRWYCFEQ